MCDIYIFVYIIYYFISLHDTTLFVQILAWRKFGEIGDFGLKSPN